MGLAVRIITTMLKRGDCLVKGERFGAHRVRGHVQQVPNIAQTRDMDELIVLDIAATPEGRGPDFEAVRKITAGCFMPVTVGGGVRNVEDVQGLLNAGADKVAVKTCIIARPRLLAEMANKFGSQAIVFAADVRGVTPEYAAWGCRQAEACGAGEILLTSIDREGTMAGYDLDLLREVCSHVDVPVIAHGGCSGYEDMLEAIRAGASAVAAGALWEYTDCTPRGAAEYLHAQGIEVRL